MRRKGQLALSVVAYLVAAVNTKTGKRTYLGYDDEHKAAWHSSALSADVHDFGSRDSAERAVQVYMAPQNRVQFWFPGDEVVVEERPAL